MELMSHISRDLITEHELRCIFVTSGCQIRALHCASCLILIYFGAICLLLKMGLKHDRSEEHFGVLLEVETPDVLRVMREANQGGSIQFERPICS